MGREKGERRWGERGKEKRGRREKGEEVGGERGKMEGRRDGERGLCKLEPEL